MLGLLGLQRAASGLRMSSPISFPLAFFPLGKRFTIGCNAKIQESKASFITFELNLSLQRDVASSRTAMAQIPCNSDRKGITLFVLTESFAITAAVSRSEPKCTVKRKRS